MVLPSKRHRRIGSSRALILVLGVTSFHDWASRALPARTPDRIDFVAVTLVGGGEMKVCSVILPYAFRGFLKPQEGRYATCTVEMVVVAECLSLTCLFSLLLHLYSERHNVFPRCLLMQEEVACATVAVGGSGVDGGRLIFFFKSFGQNPCRREYYT